jgi:hypothetical protein
MSQVCSAGACAASCIDQCGIGATQCSGNGVQTCSKMASGCLDWGSAVACGTGQSCTSGHCTSACGSCPDGQECVVGQSSHACVPLATAKLDLQDTMEFSDEIDNISPNAVFPKERPSVTCIYDSFLSTLVVGAQDAAGQWSLLVSIYNANGGDSIYDLSTNGDKFTLQLSGITGYAGDTTTSSLRLRRWAASLT